MLGDVSSYNYGFKNSFDQSIFLMCLTKIWVRLLIHVNLGTLVRLSTSYVETDLCEVSDESIRF